MNEYLEGFWKIPLHNMKISPQFSFLFILRFFTIWEIQHMPGVEKHNK